MPQRRGGYVPRKAIRPGASNRLQFPPAPPSLRQQDPHKVAARVTRLPQKGQAIRAESSPFTSSAWATASSAPNATATAAPTMPGGTSGPRGGTSATRARRLSRAVAKCVSAASRSTGMNSMASPLSGSTRSQRWPIIRPATPQRQPVTLLVRARPAIRKQITPKSRITCDLLAKALCRSQSSEWISGWRGLARGATSILTGTRLLFIGAE